MKNGNRYILLNSLNSNYETNFVLVMAVKCGCAGDAVIITQLLALLVADYFRGLIEPVQNSLNDLGSSFQAYCSNPATIDNLVQNVICVAQLLANYILRGKTTSNTSPDIEFGERKYQFVLELSVLLRVV